MKTLRPRRKEFASLESLYIEGSEDGPTIVLFHGFGADMTDLASLAAMIEAPEGTNWVFPNGHMTVKVGGYFEGRAWFPISLAELERSIVTGVAVDWSERVPPGLEDTRRRVAEFIDALAVPPEKLILGGFSQGSMVAIDLVTQMERPPAGLAILSGTLINRSEWENLAPRHKGMPFFQSHGTNDPVLGFTMAQKLQRFLIDSGWKGQLIKFEGGHEIPPLVISHLNAYLRRQLS